ncbi:hypothetical protein COEREDRAFT_11883 [Coemansia reversa NRRL 1564]|uniref:TFIIB-type domain-containing protein n=1 Tax=Coemansia reversa (strain ATCC 12441 / NRRL 1564) TaxID=763665 RepID=A0A2G5B1X6_COERN|nr:hypothetical protein COEREDRAFT_11883 [Coemansia reversa NRRL 1564]|eukprot:PIA13023.1 hypothetical protein COEREDRAFT_11883 [Coemansia reversa NRRL 1564]
MGDDEPRKRMRLSKDASASLAGQCNDCGSMSLIQSGGDEYCGDCGAVVDSVILTSDYSYEAREEQNNYIRFKQHIDESDPGDVRFHNAWNQSMIKEAHVMIGGICTNLGQNGIVDRTRVIFDKSVKGLMKAKAKVVFGRNTVIRISACIYIAAQEDNRVVNLVDIARATHTSVFIIGREVKRTLRSLNMRFFESDPLLRAESSANRVFGFVLKTRDDTEMRKHTLDCISVSAKIGRLFPAQLLDFLSVREHLRPKLVEMTGLIMEFCRSCLLHTGMNPNTLACTAVAMGIEHIYVSCEDTDECALKRNQREVIFKFVSLSNGASHHTISRHVSATQKALIEASKTVPWLSGMKLTADSVSLHTADIVFCYGQARSWLFSLNPETPNDDVPAVVSTSTKVKSNMAEDTISGIPDLISKLSKAPSFARAETQREHRIKLLDKCNKNLLENSRDSNKGDDDRETVVIRKLQKLGVNRDTLLTMPIHTLEQIFSATARSRNLDGNAETLDLPTVGPEDMSEDEVRLYLHSEHNQENAAD